MQEINEIKIKYSKYCCLSSVDVDERPLSNYNIIADNFNLGYLFQLEKTENGVFPLEKNLAGFPNLNKFFQINFRG